MTIRDQIMCLTSGMLWGESSVKNRYRVPQSGEEDQDSESEESFGLRLAYPSTDKLQIRYVVLLIRSSETSSAGGNFEAEMNLSGHGQRVTPRITALLITFIKILIENQIYW
jgi:hypothetical protein